MQHNMKEIGKRYIELFQSNEREYQRAKQSQYCEETDYSINQQISINESNGFILYNRKQNKFAKGILKLRGLPFQCADQDIADFFMEYELVENGIYRGFTNGRPSGEAYTLFKTKDQADKAHALLNMQKIGHRYIEIFSATIKEFKLFLSKSSQDYNQCNQQPFFPQNTFNQQLAFQSPAIPQYQNPLLIANYFDPGLQYQLIDQQQQQQQQQPLEQYYYFLEESPKLTKSGKTVQMLPKIPIHKKKCTLILFGLPFNVVKKEIIAFFKGFEIQQHDIFMMSNPNGKFNGKATVMFESEDEAQRAIKAKNMDYLRDRYIEIFEYK